MLAFSVSFLFCTSVKLARLSEGRPVYQKGSGSTARFLWVGRGRKTLFGLSAQRIRHWLLDTMRWGIEFPNFFLCRRQCYMGKEQVDRRAGKRANVVHPIPLSTFPKLHWLPLFQYIFSKITNMTCKVLPWLVFYSSPCDVLCVNTECERLPIFC